MEESVLSVYQQEHLDTMIRLAFMLDESDEIDTLMTADEQITSGITGEDEGIFQPLEAAQNTVEAQARSARKSNSRKKMKKIASRTLTVTACFVLVAVLSFATAFAVSPAFRSGIANIVLAFDPDRTEVSLSYHRTRQNNITDIPQEWTGDLFPAYIPEGLTLTVLEPETKLALWEGDDGIQVFFTELSKDTVSVAGTKDAKALTINYNGATFYMITADVTVANAKGCHVCDITGQLGDAWFNIVTNYLDDDTALEIADSVYKCK